MPPFLAVAVRRTVSLFVSTLIITLLIFGPALPVLAQERDDPVSQRTDHLEGEVAYGWLTNQLPSQFFDIVFLRVQLWQWIGLLLVAIFAYLVSMVVIAIVLRSLRSFVARTKTTFDDELLAHARHPGRFLLTVILFSIGTRILLLSPLALKTITGLEKGLIVAAACWVVFWVVNAYSRMVSRRLEEENRKSALSMVIMGRRALKVTLLGLAVITILHNLGFEVSSLLAGLGIGGVALALASQKTLENMLGGVEVVVDQPVRVGDFCKFGDKMGTVEDVGIRSTRIRTLDRTVVTVPNGAFSALQLENYGVRDRLRLLANIGLRYETSPDQLRWVIAGLRRLLVAHPMVATDTVRVRFVGFGDSSLDLEVVAYVLTVDWAEFLGIREDLYLRMMDIIEEGGSGFAFPSQTAYMARDTGLDTERTKAAEADVASWRQEGRMPFPAMSESEISEINDTIDWPPPEGAGGD